MKLAPNTTLLFIGDSITDCGRAQPVGENEGLGGGYPAYAAALLGQAYPGEGIRIQNTATSGHTSRHLVGRWQRDVLDLQPDYVSVMIGVNDVWRRLDRPLMKELHVYEEEYRANLTRMARDTLPNAKGMFFLSPFVIDPNPKDQMRALCAAYAGIMRQVAAEQGIEYVDVQAAFDAYCEKAPLQAITGDRVHPAATGQMLIARVFLSAVGFCWQGE